MNTVIRFVDCNADGCGTDISAVAILTGPKVTEQTIAAINAVITKCKHELEGEWTTDDILDTVTEHLKSIDYIIRWVTPTIDIEF